MKTSNVTCKLVLEVFYPNAKGSKDSARIFKKTREDIELSWYHCQYGRNYAETFCCLEAAILTAMGND